MKSRKLAIIVVAVLIALFSSATAFADDVQGAPAPAPMTSAQQHANAAEQAAQEAQEAARQAAQAAAKAEQAAQTAQTQAEREQMMKAEQIKALDDNSTPEGFTLLDRIETIIYGMPQTGALMSRLSRAETDVFGRPLPGSVTERQSAMIGFLERGFSSQPSLLYKIGMAEWGTARRVHPEWSLARRVDNSEMLIDGSVTGGALATRVERLIAKLIPEGANVEEITVPAGTVVKAALLKTLTVRNTKVGDKVALALTNEVIIDNVVVAPAGSRLLAHVTKVKPPRSFGRSSVIEMQFESLETIAPSLVPVGFGDISKKAQEVDASTAGAVGASAAGAIIFGPVGLVGGAFIRGNDRQLKEGNIFYAETFENSTVKGYRIPGQLATYAMPPRHIGTMPQGGGAQQPAPAPAPAQQ